MSTEIGEELTSGIEGRTPTSNQYHSEDPVDNRYLPTLHANGTEYPLIIHGIG